MQPEKNEETALGNADEEGTLITQYSIAEKLKKDIHLLVPSLPENLTTKNQLIEYSRSQLPALQLISDKGLRNAIVNFFFEQISEKYGMGISEQDKKDFWK